MHVSLSISIMRDATLPPHIEWWVHQAEQGNVDAAKQQQQQHIHTHTNTIPNITAVQNWYKLIL